jgi:hypothetical protein
MAGHIVARRGSLAILIPNFNDWESLSLLLPGLDPSSYWESGARHEPAK